MDGLKKVQAHQHQAPSRQVRLRLDAESSSREGRLNLGWHQPFAVARLPFTNQVLAIGTLERKGNWQVRLRKVLRAPQAFDEKVARLHLGALLAHAPQAFDEQSEYIGIPVNGPTSPTLTVIRKLNNV
jgi:adenosylhomocysteinase